MDEKNAFNKDLDPEIIKIRDKKIGNVLIDTKKWWIENNFKPLKNQCINFALQFLPSSSGR